MYICFYLYKIFFRKNKFKIARYENSREISYGFLDIYIKNCIEDYYYYIGYLTWKDMKVYIKENDLSMHTLFSNL